MAAICAGVSVEPPPEEEPRTTGPLSAVVKCAEAWDDGERSPVVEGDNPRIALIVCEATLSPPIVVPEALPPAAAEAPELALEID